MSGNIFPDIIELLKNTMNGNIKDYTIEIEVLENEGDGYGGDIVLAHLIGKKTNKKRSMVVKQQKTHEGKPISYTTPMFKNEIHFYSAIWPCLKNFYHQATGKNFATIVPECLGVFRGEYKSLALEDLHLKGFIPYHKTKPFDHEHNTSILQTYGIFHEVSMAFKQQNYEEYNKLVKCLCPLYKTAFGIHTYSGKETMKIFRLSKRLFDPESDSGLIEKLKFYEKVGPTLIDNCLRQGAADGVILHADCWSNNFMFKYDEAGNLKDLRMIDFQLVFSGSPVFDLSYCIYSGGSPETFDNLDHYLKIYHSSLTDTLREFGLDSEQIYPFVRLKDEWRKYCKYGFAMGLMLWNIKLADKKEIQIAEPEDLEPFKIADGLQDEYNQRIKDLIWHMYKNYYL